MKNQKKDSFIKQAFVTRTHGFIDVSEKREIWNTIAEKYDGNFSVGKTIDHVLETLRLQIPYKGCMINASESDTRPLKFEVVVNFTQVFDFNISWEDTVEKFFKLFGKQDIIIGEDEFDDKFLIQSNNPDLLKQTLSDSKIKQLIIKHNIYLLNSKYDKKNDRTNILCVINRTTDSLVTLNELIELQMLLIDKFEEIGMIN